MFQKKKDSKIEQEQKASSINIVGLGTAIKGDLTTNGDIRIDGKIEGSLTSKAKVVVGHTGQVEGDIFANAAEISGNVKGDVRVGELLYLKSTALIQGNIYSNKLVIENGANLTGYCKTGVSETKSILNSKEDAGIRQRGKEEAIA